MNVRMSHYFGILTAFALVLGNAAVSLADDEFFEIPDGMQMEIVSMTQSDDADFESGESDSEYEGPEYLDEDYEDYEDDFELPTVDPMVEQEEFLKKLHSELNLSGAEYRQVLNNITATQRQLNLVSEKKATLESQLATLDESVMTTTKKLFDAVRQIVQFENQIILINDQIQIKEIAFEEQKNLLKDYIRILYEQENSFLGKNEKGEVDALKLLLSDETVGENLKELQYFSLLSEAGQQMADKLDRLSKELVIYKEQVKTNRINLQGLKTQLDLEKASLEEQRQAKENLLKATSGQEEIYSQLLAQTIKEQEEMLKDIKDLDNAVNSIKEKIANGESFDTEEYESFLDEKSLALYKLQLEEIAYNGKTQFAWPVEPSRGISAYFQEPSYQSTFGMKHNAIDLPVLQGSLVRSTANGVVHKTKDNGYGYSYIIVAHAGGFMSVYGHMSGILVAEGDTVKQGSILGLSGGMPGTKGAGYMTTGPHLHFELLANGVYTDPLNYLPLDAISFEHIERLPEHYVEAWKAQSLVSRKGPVNRIPSNLD